MLPTLCALCLAQPSAPTRPVPRTQSRAIVGMLRKIGVLGKDGLIQFDVRVVSGGMKRRAGRCRGC